MNIESTDHRVSYIGRLDLGGDDGIVDDRTGTGQKGTVRKAGSGNVSDTWGKSRSDSGQERKRFDGVSHCALLCAW
jgi:hypothetical protein